MAKKVTRVIKTTKKKGDSDLLADVIADINESDLTPEPEPPAKTESETDIQKEIHDVLGGDYSTEAPASDTVVIDAPLPKKPRKSKTAEVVAPVPAPRKIVIPPKLVVRMADKIFSRLICGADALISKDEAIDPALLQAEDDQLDDLIPMAQEMIDSWKLGEHPTLFFLGSFAMIQFTNYTMIKALLKKKKKDESTAGKSRT